MESETTSVDWEWPEYDGDMDIDEPERAGEHKSSYGRREEELLTNSPPSYHGGRTSNPPCASNTPKPWLCNYTTACQATQSQCRIFAVYIYRAITATGGRESKRGGLLCLGESLYQGSRWVTEESSSKAQSTEIK